MAVERLSRKAPSSPGRSAPRATNHRTLCASDYLISSIWSAVPNKQASRHLEGRGPSHRTLSLFFADQGLCVLSLEAVCFTTEKAVFSERQSPLKRYQFGSMMIPASRSILRLGKVKVLWLRILRFPSQRDCAEGPLRRSRVLGAEATFDKAMTAFSSNPTFFYSQEQLGGYLFEFVFP